MTKTRVHVTTKESISAELDQQHRDICCRAYEISCAHGSGCPDALADWFRAEHELLRRPPIELRERNGMLELEASVGGVDPKHLDVQVTPVDILITATDAHGGSPETTVHASEFRRERLFRAIHLPRAIEPDTVKAELCNGLLTLTAGVAVTTSEALHDNP